MLHLLVYLVLLANSKLNNQELRLASSHQPSLSQYPVLLYDRIDPPEKSITKNKGNTHEASSPTRDLRLAELIGAQLSRAHRQDES